MFTYRSVMPAPAAAVFRWHEQPEGLAALVPKPWVRIESRQGGIRDGGRVVLSIGIGPLRFLWEARHYGYVDGVEFRDEQLKGPFRIWRHTHRVDAVDARSSVLEDRVEYALPGGRLFRSLAGPFVRFTLARMFARRHAITGAEVGG